MTFRTARDRDAWFTIRGFVYQVELSVLEWLQLGADEALELERGEDIDKITQGLSAGEERLLEQIKHREDHITLNSTEARAALANFVEHQEANPSVNLSFRFITTAEIGEERDPKISRGGKGIALWESFRTETQSAGCLAKLAALRLCLRRAKPRKPPEVPDTSWNRLHDFLQRASAANMAKFVRSFEWRTGCTKQESLKATIISFLMTQGWAATELQAEEQYNACFVRVFQILSGKGIKRLSTGERHSLLSRPTLSASDSDLLQRITGRLAIIEAKVEAIGQRVTEHHATLDEIQSKMESYGITARIAATGPIPNLALPSGAKKRVKRDAVVSAIVEQFKAHAWVTIYGMSGAGKTELAILVAERFAARSWVTLRGMSEEQSLFRLTTALTPLAGSPPLPARDVWYDELCRRVDEGHVLVIDDLPQFDIDGPLGQELTTLAEAFFRNNLKLLVTSAVRPSGRLQNRLDAIVGELETPKFSEEDVREVCHLAEAPIGWGTDERVRLIRAITAGHAQLLSAVVSFLKRKAWRFDDDELNALIRRDYADAIGRDVMQRLAATALEEPAHDLLLRLTQFMGIFTIEDAVEVSNAAPVLRFPRRILSSLEGPWLQRVRDGEYAVCPLLNGFGDDLPDTTRREVNRIIAERMARNTALGPVEVMIVIAHFARAGMFEQAGLLYCTALNEFENAVEPVYDAGLGLLWATTPLPTAMSAGVRVYIRTLQLRVGTSNQAFMVEEIFRLVDELGAEDTWSLLATLPRVDVLAKHDFARTNALFLRIFRTQQKTLRIPTGRVIDTPDKLRADGFLWHLADLAATETDVRAFLQSLESLAADGPNKIVSSGDEYEGGCMALCDRRWMIEEDKPRAVRDWNSVHALLIDIAATGRKLKLDMLHACAERARILVLASYLGRLEEAVALAEQCLAEYAHDSRVILLVCECMGRQLLFGNRLEDAVSYLKRAVLQDTPSLRLHRLHAMQFLCIAVSKTNAEKACTVAETAVEFARSIEGLQREALVKALGELAIARWKARGIVAAFAPCFEAVSLMLDGITETADQKNLFVRLVHAASCFSSIARNTLPKSDEELEQGLLLNYRQESAELYAPRMHWVMCAFLAEFADAIGEDRKAVACVVAVLAADITLDPALLPLVQYLQHIWDIDQVCRDSIPSIFRSICESKDENALREIFFMSSMRLGLIYIEDREKAKQLALAAKEECRKCSERSPSANSWKLAALILEGFCDVATTEQLARISDVDGLPVAFRGAARISASVQQDRTLEIAIEDHIVVAKYLAVKMHGCRTLYRRLWAPFVSRFWECALEEKKEEIRALSVVPLERRVQAVLHLVAATLNQQFTASIEDWLSQGVN